MIVGGCRGDMKPRKGGIPIHKVTIHDVARQAGVTPSTVSRVLNGSQLVKPATRQRVLDAVRSLGYTPNKRAQMFKSGKTFILGLVVAQQHISEMVFNAGFQAQFKALTEKAHSEGYNLLIITSTEADYQSYLDVIRNQAADGFIILGSLPNGILSSMLDEAGIPYVFNMKYSSNPEDRCYISADDEEGGYIAAKYLLDLNHTDIRFLVGDVKGNVLSFNLDRISGFKKALAEYGVPYSDDMVVPIPGQMEESYAGVRRLFQSEQPSALLVSNEITTVACLNYLTDSGLRVPRDVSLIGFGNSDFFRSLRPNLTNVSYDMEWSSKKLVDLLLRRIQGKPIPELPPKKPELVIRDSTARKKDCP